MSFVVSYRTKQQLLRLVIRHFAESQTSMKKRAKKNTKNAEKNVKNIAAQKGTWQQNNHV